MSVFCKTRLIRLFNILENFKEAGLGIMFNHMYSKNTMNFRSLKGLDVSLYDILRNVEGYKLSMISVEIKVDGSGQGGEDWGYRNRDPITYDLGDETFKFRVKTEIPNIKLYDFD
jgi:hypothetical protein